jgi:hypothetical protein
MKTLQKSSIVMVYLISFHNCNILMDKSTKNYIDEAVKPLLNRIEYL